MSAESNQTIPSEFRISKKWDDVIEHSIVNVSMGVLTAGVASIVLFRGRNTRMAFTALGAGFGAGMSYKQASYEFDQEKGASK
eukprot:CAMPEP_0202971854 /NCGR_PEP_ID=MMETSP1396-20130829/31623_1 /ASSEMBLY_ACC=CAM_ASM_000872 /TAXON_ID= /ORGANISM="Pseudokeronopsis sp., Strain Brazil" /LENGTH=82 /DNA_ID=CAMNT_0049701691 /DNA_START=62 /DNA_END=310 /DNA_ORIENTATION=-